MNPLIPIWIIMKTCLLESPICSSKCNVKNSRICYNDNSKHLMRSPPNRILLNFLATCNSSNNKICPKVRIYKVTNSQARWCRSLSRLGSSRGQYSNSCKVWLKAQVCRPNSRCSSSSNSQDSSSNNNKIKNRRIFMRTCKTEAISPNPRTTALLLPS